MSNVKHQLIAGTYCKFATKKECKDAWDKALGLPVETIYEYRRNDNHLIYLPDGYLMSCKDNDKSLQKATEITAAEFLARMENKWEDEQLTLSQAIAKLEAEGWRFSEDGQYAEAAHYFTIVKKHKGAWQVDLPLELEVALYDIAARDLQTAIDACELLNNAKN